MSPSTMKARDKLFPLSAFLKEIIQSKVILVICKEK